MRRIHHIVTCVLAGILLLGAFAPVATASQSPSADGTPAAEVDSGPKFVLRPHDGQDGAYFDVRAEAGSTIELTAVLGNAGTEAITLRTFTSDAVVLVNGGFGVQEEEEELTGATTWIDWPTETYTFEPGEGIERTFTVTIPDDTAPGEYIAGISLQTADPIEIEGSTMFNQIIRKVIAVFITVEGDTSASFELGEPEIITTPGGSRLDVPVINTGDVLVRPTGTVTLTTEDGNEMFSAEIAMGSVYAHMDTQLSIPLDANLAGREYEIALDLADSSTNTHASLEPQPVLFSGEIQAEAPVQIQEVAIVPMPDADEPVYAEIDLTIANTGEQLTNATVVLHVYHNDEIVEDFTLGSNMNIATGETSISQRYIPAQGFSSGDWTFTITIETVTTQTNATTQVLHESIPDAISIP